MENVKVNASKIYDILIGRQLLSSCGQYVSQVMKPCKLCLVTDATVYRLYGELVEASLSSAGFQLVCFSFDGGEQSKTMDTVSQILEFMAEREFTRGDGIVALGGGIVGDVAGFAASAFLRGVRFVQIPTTLLAAVDSSVGGKTGVNLGSGKNLAGAFWQPSLVLCDCNVFNTLPYHVFLDGIAEAVKYGIIADRSLFDLLHLQGKGLYQAQVSVQSESLNASPTDKSDKSDIMVEIVKRCVTIKADIVSKDERDTGVRQLLNFGHTIGHAIEKVSDYSVSHGHAVALGMLIVSGAAADMNLCPSSCHEDIREILELFSFPLECKWQTSDLTKAALSDKKRFGNEITLVLPEDTGHCYLKGLPVDTLHSFIDKGLGSVIR